MIIIEYGKTPNCHKNKEFHDNHPLSIFYCHRITKKSLNLVDKISQK